MKSLNKTVTPIFLSVVCFLFPKAIFVRLCINTQTFSNIFVAVKQLQEMAKPIFWKKNKNYFKMLSAENDIQQAKTLRKHAYWNI